MLIINKRSIYDFSLENRETETLHQLTIRCLSLAYNEESEFELSSEETTLLGKLMFSIEKVKNMNT